MTDRRDDIPDEPNDAAAMMQAKAGAGGWQDSAWTRPPLPLPPIHYALAERRHPIYSPEATTPRPLTPRAYVRTPPAAFEFERTGSRAAPIVEFTVGLTPPRPLAARSYRVAVPSAPTPTRQPPAIPVVRPALVALIKEPAPARVIPTPQPAFASAPSATIAAPASMPPLRLEIPRDVRPGATAPHFSPSPPHETSAPAPSWPALARRVGKIALLAFAGWMAAVLLLILVYRVVDPPTSSLMVQQRLSGQEVVQQWTPLTDVSPDVIRAVMLSEDGRFCQHSGVDYEEIQNALERAGEGTPRGASTISMQVIKNLFLWPSKSYVRKAIELPLTYAMEFVWPKQRIMEVYLNIAEWGPGIFGVEAASQHHFNKSARVLNDREAARLAVALPNPMLRDAGDPGPRTRRLAADIEGRMRAAPRSQTACVVTSRKPPAPPLRRRAPAKQPTPQPEPYQEPPWAREDDWDAAIQRYP